MWRWVWWSTLLVVCSSCGTARYRSLATNLQPLSVGKARPTRAVDSNTTQGEVHPLEAEVSIELELEPGTRLLRAGQRPWQNRRPGEPPGSPRCVEPVAELQTIDGVPRYGIEPPVLAGRHTLTLSQAPSSEPIALETERLGVRHCDLVATGWPHVWEREPFWFGDLRVGFTGILPRLSYGGLQLLVARWTGPLRLGAELGVVNAVTIDCPEDQDCDPPYALPLGFHASVSRHAGDSLFLSAGARLVGLLAQEDGDAPVGLRAVSLQAQAEALVGSALRQGHDDAPGGAIIAIGVEAGPALVLGQRDAGPGMALGFHLSYGYAP